MKTIKVPGGALPAAAKALDELSQSRLPLMLAVRINRLSQAVGEFYGPWLDRMRPLITKYTGGATTIGPEHRRHAEFVADAEVQELFAEDCALRLEPIPLTALAEARYLEVSPETLGTLTGLGLVTDEDPAPKKSTSRRRKKT